MNTENKTVGETTQQENSAQARAIEYKVEFNTVYNRNKSADLIYLEVSINDSLQELLRKGIVPDEKTELRELNVRDENAISELRSIARYKIRTYVFNVLEGYWREYLFIDSLIDSKKISLPFDSADILKRAVRDFKRNIQLLIEGLNHLEVKQETVFKQVQQ